MIIKTIPQRKPNLGTRWSKCLIHIRLPEDLHRRVRIRAAESDRTIQDWVVAALQKAINQQNKKRG